MLELPAAGDEFAGYLLRSVIGRGGASVVYQAEHPRLGTGIALKVLAANLAADEIFRTRFLAESRIAASMDHPHVIPIYDVGLSDGLLFTAMHRVSGTDLRQMIAEHGRVQPPTATFLLGQAAGALDAAHRMGLVHRNVKPENLLIERDDAGSEHLYLADFGISRLGMARNGLTSTGRFLGTVDYVAPEQISGPSVYGSADQYSLGCVLYECLTGRVPLDKDLPTDLSPMVDTMFARVLAERPGDRYNTCREFMRAASAALGDMATAPLSSAGSRTPQPEAAPADYQSAPAPASDLAAPTPGDYQQELDHEVSEQAAGLRTRSGRLRARWLAIAAVLLLVFAGVGVGAYAGLSPQRKAAGLASSALASKPSKSPMPMRARASTLARVLSAADASRVAMGKLPLSSCKQRGMTKVVCTAPWPTVASATFTTYPTLAALYSAYKAKVRSLDSGRYRQNVKDCGLAAPSPYGEITWNHQEQHSRAYAVDQMIAGKVPVQIAMGRMACMVTASHSEDIVWTTDYGKMLGVAIGRGSHTGVWYWWIAVHHNIVFPGTPMHMGRKAVRLMSGAPMPKPSTSGSSS